MSEKQEEVQEGLHYVLSTGFYGGLFASALTYLAYLLNFIPFGPGVILQMLTPFLDLTSINSVLGQIASIFLISFMSIAGSYLYYLLLRKRNSLWFGAGYGLAWWGIIFLGVNQLIPRLKSIYSLGLTTNIIFISIFIFYGLFIGYSISYYYNVESLQRNS